MATIMPADADHMIGSGSCGICAPMRELRIVDDQERDVGPDEVGELWVAGPDTLSGYYNRPEANAESFRGRWFRTGDLFRRDAAGYYTIVGRVKEMIKRSGENIAAREVEAVLKAIPGVADAAVVPVPDPIRKEEVKAFIIRKDDAARRDLTPAAIIEQCRKDLAAFKLPRFIEFTDDLPRTVTGTKIAKAVLLATKPDHRIGAYDTLDGEWH